MKKYLIVFLASAMLMTSCGPGQTTTSSTGTVLAGAVIGGNVGGALGGLIGDSNRGPRGGYRGSAIGTIVGTIAGAAIASAATSTTTTDDDYSYRVERQQRQSSSRRYYQSSEVEPTTTYSAFESLKISNIRFVDDNRDHVINGGESSKIIFEIMNEGSETAYNIVPVVDETTEMKNLYISPSVVIEQIAPHNGVKYTANIQAGERIKTGNVTFHIGIADEYGQEYDWQEFTLPTER